jgi:hypothetical protein
MDTAQTVLSQGNATQRVQAVTSAVTSIVPWIAIAVLFGLLVWIMMMRKNK